MCVEITAACVWKSAVIVTLPRLGNLSLLKSLPLIRRTTHGALTYAAHGPEHNVELLLTQS